MNIMNRIGLGLYVGSIELLADECFRKGEFRTGGSPLEFGQNGNSRTSTIVSRSHAVTDDLDAMRGRTCASSSALLSEPYTILHSNLPA